MSQTRLFVGNLSDDVNEELIREAFSAYGKVTNLDLKNKSTADNQKKFAFVTISASNSQIESCIRHFSSHDLLESRLYVTRARESFLERLQRERQEAHIKQINNIEKILVNEDTIQISIPAKIKKRKFEQDDDNGFTTIEGSTEKKPVNNSKSDFDSNFHMKTKANFNHVEMNGSSENYVNKKQDSDKKRLESIKAKRKEFKDKQKIIKIGFEEIDKNGKNKKIIFDDNENDEVNIHNNINANEMDNRKQNHTKSLFDDNEETDDDTNMEINFEMKEKFASKKGQKVLELQSRYKSDKRFTLDERFIDDDEDQQSDEGNSQDIDEAVEIGQADEKAKQLNILQQVLGVAIKSKLPQHEELKDKKKKPKIGMLRFDPSQPDHAKFLLPTENKKEEKSVKKKKNEKAAKESDQVPKPELPKIEVSKEQFYEISDTLKDAITQPNSFSLRSMFARDDDEVDEKDIEHEDNYLPLETKKGTKIKNPLDPGNVNPFKYDSSDSETEETVKQEPPKDTEVANVWRENLFFSKEDIRLKDGLAFFNRTNDSVKKERRNLKFIMKKRLYNKDRKNQMFHKKVGGRKKSVKKSSHRKK